MGNAMHTRAATAKTEMEMKRGIKFTRHCGALGERALPFRNFETTPKNELVCGRMGK
jgi:hypothetical protein